ncbi:MAG: hypothetical protein K2M52_03405, partial [Paramuribaculum sp.]|nr:hypothetical protein [Paramuribaculum sp.]
MKKTVMSVGCALIAAGALAASPALRGFYYGDAASPAGHEWQSPDSVAYNKEQPRATFYYFADTESARKVLPENSAYWMSLD